MTEKLVNINILIDPETKSLLIDNAWKTRKTFSQYVRDILEAHRKEIDR